MFAIEMAHKCSIWSLKFYFFFLYIYLVHILLGFFFYILFYMFIFLYFSSRMPREGKSHRKKRVE
jgi:energy-coupling factor transporter transmembrane protein EcfT